MRWFFHILALIIINSAQAYTGFGVCNYGDETISSVVCNGPTVLKKTKINGDIKVTGSLQADGILVKSIDVKGSTQISDSNVSGPVNVVGDLSADLVNFQKGVSVKSDTVFLNHTKVNGLLIVTSSQKSATVQIQCGSEITGSVMFDGKPGVVEITSDNSLVRGKVVNGSITFVKKNCSQ